MLITQQSLISCGTFFPLFGPKENGRKKSGAAQANKRDFSENPNSDQKPIFPLKISNTILPQSAIAVFGLGFVDAGYSGDWSRIGVISRETEDLLKIAAFVVVPLCLFLILSFSKKQRA